MMIWDWKFAAWLFFPSDGQICLKAQGLAKDGVVFLGKNEEIQLDVKFLKFNQYPPQKLQSSSVTLGYQLFAKDVQLGGGEMDRPDWHQ